MNTEGTPADSPESILADREEVVKAAMERRPPDPGVVRRVMARSEKARQMLLATHGVQNIGVDIIRELRGPLPES